MAAEPDAFPVPPAGDGNGEAGLGPDALRQRVADLERRVELGPAVAGPAVAGARLVELLRFRGHQAEARAALSFSFSRCRLSSSFSSAIIFSSRPTTTSSNFSRSRIFSCSSVFDCSRSCTTSS